MVEKIRKENIVGYALLAAGVFMILVSVYLMSNVFTGARSPPVLVNFSGISLVIPFPVETEGAPESSPQVVEVLIVTGEALSETVSIGFWYTFMFFIMMAGGRLASLGVELVKEPRRDVKERGVIPSQAQTPDAQR